MQRVKLDVCAVKGCPAPESREWHTCWLRGHGECFGGISHQHTKKRSAGGKVIDACLCMGHHDKVDNGLWGNKITIGKTGQVWVAYDDDHTILVRKVLQPPWWEYSDAEVESLRIGQSTDLETDQGPAAGGSTRASVSPLPGGIEAGDEAVDGSTPDTQRGGDVVRIGEFSTGNDVENGMSELQEERGGVDRVLPGGIEAGAGELNACETCHSRRWLCTGGWCAGDKCKSPHVPCPRCSGALLGGIEAGDEAVAHEESSSIASELDEPLQANGGDDAMREAGTAVQADQHEPREPMPSVLGSDAPDSRTLAPEQVEEHSEPESVERFTVGASTETGIGNDPAVRSSLPAPEWGDTGLTLPSEYRLEDVGPWIAEVRKHKQGNQWFAGDLYGDMEERFGERASQYIEDFGYTPESLANAIRVCKAWPKKLRNGNLTFGHHAVLQVHPQREAWLRTAELSGLSVAALRRALKPPVPKPPKYTIAQLYEALEGFQCTEFRNNGRAFTMHFIKSLEEQE